MEEWKTFLEYDCQHGHTFFEVSTEGRIRNGRTGQLRRLFNDAHGYKLIGLGYPQKTFPVHRIVAKAFIPNPKNLPEIDHINGDPADNRVENLRWVTHIENINNPIRTSRLKDAWRYGSREKPYKKSPIVLLLEKQIPL